MAQSSAIVPGIDCKEGDFPWVGEVWQHGLWPYVRRGSCVVVGSNAVMTAAHVVTGPYVIACSIQGQLYYGSVHLHPGYLQGDDVAVIVFAPNTFSGGYAVAQQYPVPGQAITVVGYGLKGHLEMYDERLEWVYTYGSADGTRRWCGNHISYVNVIDSRMAYDFDEIGNPGRNYFGDSWVSWFEGAVGNNDSGGPSLSYIDDHWQVVGLHRSVINWYFQDPERPQGHLQSSYGAVSSDIIAKQYRGWMQLYGADLYD